MQEIEIFKIAFEDFMNYQTSPINWAHFLLWGKEALRLSGEAQIKEIIGKAFESKGDDYSSDLIRIYWIIEDIAEAY